MANKAKKVMKEMASDMCMKSFMSGWKLYTQLFEFTFVLWLIFMWFGLPWWGFAIFSPIMVYLMGYIGCKKNLPI